MEKRKSFLSVKEMVEMALLVALAVVLDLDGFKISLSADGGSIGFTMVPLFILGYRHGFFKSLIGVGVIYGLTTALLDGHGLVYYPFDYFIAYGVSISVGSLFSKAIFYKGEYGSDKVLNILSLVLSVLITGIVRVLGSSLSSMVFYEYTFEASVAYNISYVGPSIIICLLVLIVLYPTLRLLNKKFPTNFTKKF